MGQWAKLHQRESLESVMLCSFLSPHAPIYVRTLYVRMAMCQCGLTSCLENGLVGCVGEKGGCDRCGGVGGAPRGSLVATTRGRRGGCIGISHLAEEFDE